MRFLRYQLVVVCSVLSACGLWQDSDFPASAERFAPPAHFQTWWQVVEACSGRTAPLRDVLWYAVPPFQLQIDGESAYGAWFARSNRIALIQDVMGDPVVVRHEMLHAILRDGDHPAEYFQQRCGDEVMCGPGCGARISYEQAKEIRPESLDVQIRLFPDAPSLSAFGGKATVVVEIRNPRSEVVFTRLGLAQCWVGFLIATRPDGSRQQLSCSYPRRAFGDRAFFAAGESQRVVIEANLIGDWFTESPGIGPITLSAVLGDNVRQTRHTSILP